MSPDQQWSILASIAQLIQALVVIVGVPLVILQVRNLRAEGKHRQWEALQWALGLLQKDVEDATLVFHERLDAQPGAYTFPDETARDLIVHLSGSLTVVQVATEQKYVDRALLFTSVGPNLARLHQLIVSTKHDGSPLAGLATAFTNFPGMKLLEEARAWHDATSPGPTPSMSQVAHFGNRQD